MKTSGKANQRQISFTQFLMPFLLVFIISACQQQGPYNSVGGDAPAENMEEIQVAEDFNYNTTQSYLVKLTLQDDDGVGISSVKVGIYDDKTTEGGNLISSGVTDEQGKVELNLSLPGYMDSLSIRPAYMGILSEAYVPLNSEVIDLTIGGPNETVLEVPEETTQGLSTKVVIWDKDWYYTIGGWDRMGVPDYLEKRDKLSKEFLEDLNTTLPEYKKLPDLHPEYFNDEDMNTILQQDASVWVTFVHEGVLWQNALGFYTYDPENPPASPDDIDSLFMAFPNASYKNSGGGLKSGDKVKIGEFKAGTAIGWFLVPASWSRRYLKVTKSPYIKWSTKAYNTYATEENRQHMVALKDDSRELILLGFEDMTRPRSWDADFNDCVFYVTTSSYSAVKTQTMQRMQTKSDADKDGVDDISDAYPNDPERAYNQYSPAKDVDGSLAYEDLWPLKGDYDFNDLVVDYNHKLVLNAENKVVEMVSTFKTRAIGGAFKNGFGYVLDIAPDMVKSVTGTHLTENIISTNANGTESGQQKAVVVVYDNAFAHMSPVSGYTVNAEKGSPQVEPFVAEVKVDFVTPLSASSLGKSPYRAFIISNKRRGYEIHLPGDAPTDLCDTKLFGTGDDNTNKGSKNYFKTKKSHPWAIHTPEQFDYPAEKNDIVKAFIYLKQWAESAGTRYSDWFRKKSKYRNDKMIY